jgi:hypothetical protein
MTITVLQAARIARYLSGVTYPRRVLKTIRYLRSLIHDPARALDRHLTRSCGLPRPSFKRVDRRGSVCRAIERRQVAVTDMLRAELR